MAAVPQPGQRVAHGNAFEFAHAFAQPAPEARDIAGRGGEPQGAGHHQHTGQRFFPHVQLAREHLRAGPGGNGVAERHMQGQHHQPALAQLEHAEDEEHAVEGHDDDEQLAAAHQDQRYLQHGDEELEAGQRRIVEAPVPAADEDDEEHHVDEAEGHGDLAPVAPRQQLQPDAQPQHREAEHIGGPGHEEALEAQRLLFVRAVAFERGVGHGQQG